MLSKMTNVLTIAGSDPVGGAGLQADLKAIEASGAHGCTVVTCITAQNTKMVASIYPVPSAEVDKQLKAVLSDVRMDAVKTGMLYSAETVKVVASRLKGFDGPIVVDPVMVATTGASLHEEGFVDELRRRLIPMATLLTPNLFEAEVLSGVKVRDSRTARRAANAILEEGPDAVLLKGGHLGSNDALDLLFMDGDMIKISSPRVDAEVHGTGCVLASIIAVHLAQGYSVEEAVRVSKSMTYRAILARESVGRGIPCVNPLAVLRGGAQKASMLEDLQQMSPDLEALLTPQMLPEVGSNIGYAVSGALGPEEVAAFAGRIVRVGDRARTIGCAGFGASKHIARIVLAASTFDPSVRCALNFKYSEDNLRACRRAKLTVASFDRAQEPDEASSMTWGVTHAIEKRGSVPDVIFDRGGPGKEPMIRLLGRDPSDVLSKLRSISSKIESR
ncbi:MAG TPA: bifunctional hydroxymethylpyrimidine kinase/phosphomethylpyrimidine kinase [Thermoplasmata archaeon]|nr:bifunctional hydroxymethylpyrimidine kinase/phosphomethylpyrimidine kinase [Thermoplasmata archaeon]